MDSLEVRELEGRCSGARYLAGDCCRASPHRTQVVCGLAFISSGHFVFADIGALASTHLRAAHIFRFRGTSSGLAAIRGERCTATGLCDDDWRHSRRRSSALLDTDTSGQRTTTPATDGPLDRSDLRCRIFLIPDTTGTRIQHAKSIGNSGICVGVSNYSNRNLVVQTVKFPVVATTQGA